MFGLTGRELYDYGTMVFVLWLSQFLVREIWKLFKGRLAETKAVVEGNKDILVGISQTLKDVAVIQAQTLDKLNKSDEKRETFWHKMLEGMDLLCKNLNGKNPAIIKLQAEMKELKGKVDVDR
jgi:hypothetical protein